MTIFFIILFGLALGSFFNAWIYRAKKGESIMHGRSKCPHCKHTLGAKDLVPVLSWVWLKGKCRYCQKKISWQYPIVEIIGAVFMVLIFAGNLLVNYQ